MKIKIATLAILTSLLFIGCGGGASGGQNDSSRDTTTSFPNSFLLSSVSEPSDLEVTKQEKSTLYSHKATTKTVLTRIDELLSGTTPLNNVFTPNLLFDNAVDAECYGPRLKYTNHPDSSTPNSGELPVGDLGIWTMNNGDTTQACSAAQLDARMTGVKKRTMSGLFLLASSLDAMYDANQTLPAVGASALDVTSNMPTITDITFTLVTIEQVSSNNFEYKIEFTYHKSGTHYDIKFETTHVAGATTNQYKGLMKYQIEDSMFGGNCRGSDITRKGSLVYERTASTAFKVDAREADFCTHDTTGAGFDVNDLLDPSYRSTSYSNGWGNNYNSFISSYDASNKSGQYSYVWQAGPFDSHSRTLQIDLNNHSPVDGEAYFGYAAQVFDATATLGENLGLICNWAAPGNSHTPQLYAQRQFLEFNTTSNYFETTIARSNITYAPTNSCTYDGSGSFVYDRDINGSADANDTVIVKIGASGASELEFDLFSYTGTTVAEMISNRGANLPVGPVWP